MAKPRVVFSDWDGTITHGHVLKPIFFDILKLLKENDIPLVIVTGRSKSWAHFLLSHVMELEHVISEGGGVWSLRKESPNRAYQLVDRLLIPEQDVRRLEHTVEKLRKKFPDVELSVDSFGRQTDRAIELSYLNANATRDAEIRKFLEEEKINFSTSNVHLNFWSGEISKYNSVQTFVERQMPEVDLDDCIFFGDSLNDQSMFKAFKNSVGVSNIVEVQDRLEFSPSTILEGPENEGPMGVLSHLHSLLK